MKYQKLDYYLESQIYLAHGLSERDLKKTEIDTTYYGQSYYEHTLWQRNLIMNYQYLELYYCK